MMCRCAEKCACKSGKEIWNEFCSWLMYWECDLMFYSSSITFESKENKTSKKLDIKIAYSIAHAICNLVALLGCIYWSI